MKNIRPNLFIEHSISKRNFERATLTIVIFLVTLVCIMLSFEKSGMFIDEIWTFGLSNGHYTPFLNYIKEPGVRHSVIDQIFYRQEFLDYLTVQSNERFDFASVYFNQAIDNHPPLYYWMINIFSSINPGVFSKWTGLFLNLIIYIACQIVLYKTVRKLNGSHIIAIFSIILYGFSQIGLTTFLMIRMYILLTFLTLLLTYNIIKLRENFSIKHCWLTAINLFFGFLTHHYFVFYAFLLCLSYGFYLIYHREIKKLMTFSYIALTSVVVFFAVFPPAIEDLFHSEAVNGTSLFENLLTFSQYPKRLFILTKSALGGINIGILFGVIFTILTIINFKRLKYEHSAISNLFFISIPAFFAYCIVAIISPYTNIRYAYHLMPIFILIVSILLILSTRAFKRFYSKKSVKLALLTVTFFLSIFSLIVINEPNYIYPEQKEYNDIIKDYKNSSVIYFTNNDHVSITHDLLQLINYEQIYVDNGEHFDIAKEYLDNSDEAIIYISSINNKYEPEKFIELFCDYAGYKDARRLYKYISTEVFIITK